MGCTFLEALSMFDSLRGRVFFFPSFPSSSLQFPLRCSLLRWRSFRSRVRVLSRDMFRAKADLVSSSAYVYISGSVV